MTNSLSTFLLSFGIGLIAGLLWHSASIKNQLPRIPTEESRIENRNRRRRWWHVGQVIRRVF